MLPEALFDGPTDSDENTLPYIADEKMRVKPLFWLGVYSGIRQIM
jgi:hypothetical protein